MRRHRLAARFAPHRRFGAIGAPVALSRDRQGGGRMMLGPIGFAAPWLLLALAALPILWIILRAVPPAPIRRKFPGVALMLGLTDDESVSDRTPWWLLLLRMLAVAAIIVGLAGPVMNPQNDRAGSGPLLIVLDGSWAGATQWPGKMDLLRAQ